MQTLASLDTHCISVWPVKSVNTELTSIIQHHSIWFHPTSPSWSMTCAGGWRETFSRSTNPQSHTWVCTHPSPDMFTLYSPGMSGNGTCCRNSQLLLSTWKFLENVPADWWSLKKIYDFCQMWLLHIYTEPGDPPRCPGWGRDDVREHNGISEEGLGSSQSLY